MLDQLAFNRPQHRYVLVSRSAARAESRTNLTRYVCDNWGLAPNITNHAADLMNVEQIAALISREAPDIIFNATTPFPWWKIDALPPEQANLAASVGPGIWAALDALLPLRLCDAVVEAGAGCSYVNACYPDVINPFLWYHAGHPCVGIGNIANTIPGLRLAFAEDLGVPQSDVHITLVCHHFTSLNAPVSDEKERAPYFLQVSGQGRSQQFWDDEWPFRLFRTKFPRPRGLAGQSVTASSAATLLAAMLDCRHARSHAPGPNGLPGGYPISLQADGSIEVDLMGALKMEEAVAINIRGQKLDGIEVVAPQMIKPTDAAKAAFETIVGFELPDLSPAALQSVAEETVRRLNHRYSLGIG